jgi:nucleoside-diphosphate-sugar epimerase
MKILVTGAAGFIGSTLVDRLLRDGHDVVGVDCFTNYYSKTQKRHNLELAMNHPQFRLVERTIVSAEWDKLLPDVEQIYHLAGQPGVRASWGQEFGRYLADNVMATQVLLEACVHHASSLKSMVYASTSSVYGNNPHRPFHETALPKPISPYGVTKLAAEHLCLLYRHEHKLPIKAVRYFTVYGPRQRPDMAFHIFLKAILDGKPLPVFGDGHQRRDFTYVDDAVEGTIRAGAEIGRPGLVYNIGGGSQISLLEALDVMGAVTGVWPEMDYYQSQHGDMRDTHADIRDATTFLGYKPTVSLPSGLRKQYDWMRSYYDTVV